MKSRFWAFISIIALFFTAGCSAGGFSGETEEGGTYKLNVQWPGTSQSRVIPEETVSIVVEITGEGWTPRFLHP